MPNRYGVEWEDNCLVWDSDEKETSAHFQDSEGHWVCATVRESEFGSGITLTVGAEPFHGHEIELPDKERAFQIVALLARHDARFDLIEVTK